MSAVVQPKKSDVQATIKKNSPPEIGEIITKNKAKVAPKPYEKPRVAIVWPSDIPGNKKLVLTIPGRNVPYTTVMSHESLSVMRSWAMVNGYTLDTSRLEKPAKPKYVRPDDSESYSYR